jgi:hypothetical protein
MLNPITACPGTGVLRFEPLQHVSEQWRALTRSSKRATLYHSDAWIETLRRTYRFDFRAALLEQGGVAYAGVLFARVRRPLTRWWVALPFSDECPPLSLDGASEETLLRPLCEQFGNERFEIRGMGARPNWQTADHFLAWQLDISGSAAALYRGLETNFRRNVNKALKAGITIERGNSLQIVRRFYRLHQRSRRRMGLPCQPLHFFNILRELFGDNVDIWLASQRERDIVAIFLLGNGDTLYYKWSARDSSETSGAGHLLAWSLLEHYAGRFQRLDLGRSDFRNAGLNRFKRGLGGSSSLLPYAFYPAAPHDPPSSEVLSAKRRILTNVWRLLPEPLCRGIERFAYRYLS